MMQKAENRKRFADWRRYLFPFLLSASILFVATGCIYDKLDDCRQGINVRFYSKTLCSSDTVYPAASDVKLFVFDRNNLLVSYQSVNNIVMQPHYHKTVDAENGLFTVVAWTGLDAGEFELNEPQLRVATKDELLFRLQRTAQQAASIEGKQVYYGESPPVFLPDPAEYGSVFESTAINLQEMTNRLTVLVEGLPAEEGYEVVVESANGSMNINGNIAVDDVIQYASPPVFASGVMESKFTILRLATGYKSTLVIREKLSGNELYRGDLLGTLLLKNPDVNLACDHDFTIRFTTKDQCKCGTYMIAEIWVNEWLVHSYNVDL